MQGSDDKEERSDRGIEPSSSGGRKSQSFVYPIRSLLGPLQQSGSEDILETLLSPSILSTQTRLSEPGDGSYFPDVSVTPHQPVKTSKSAGGTPGSEDGFTFRHFPAEGANASFVTASPTISNLVEGAQADPSHAESSSIPFQIQERRDPRDGHTTLIREIELQAPVPMLPSSGVARSLQESVSSSSSLPRDDTVGFSQTSSNNGDDEGGRGGSVGSGRPPSSIAASNQSFASAGLVHLPPVSSLETQKRTREWRGRLGGSNNASAPSSHGHSVSSHPPPVKEEPEEDQGKSGSVQSGSFSVVTKSSDKSGPVVTMRFEHTEDENGHHVLVGREGRLTRCEDEPIRIPGAVQGFGVLLVVHENHSTGQLQVRQVSENSKVILGLSPKYLFDLDCFTGTLPSQQADLLWDNVQFLNDPDIEEDEEEEQNPQVFLLSGWGEPNSAIGETTDPQRRRQWTCWVAAHRVKSVLQDIQNSEAEMKPIRRLLVLEFELESDTFNPLYPVPSTPTVSRSDDSSPFAGSGTGNGSNSTPTEHTERNYSATSSNSASTNTPKASDSSTDQASTVATRTAPGEVEKPQDQEWFPSADAILQSTTSRSRPLRSLERMRRFNRIGASLERTVAPSGRGSSHGVGTMDVFAVLQEINEQLGKALDLLELLQIVVGVIKDLTQFHRVLLYQFDDSWNGQVVAELVDWNQTHDLYFGLHFPAADIPAQARQLYATNRVRILYDRGQTTARLVVKDRSDLEPPLDMTHCYLRAMSPIHLKYLGNMGVRASMSISIIAFQKLWGLVACHSYGDHGMRVSFPVRQMLRLLSDSISRNVERLSYAQRLRTRKLISTVPTDQHPTGYIVSNSEDLLTLFDADCGVLVIGEGAKILGPNEHGQDILLLAEYLRVKQFTLLQVSQSVMQDYPDLQLPSGLDVIAGLLYVPLSMTGKDFIALLRKGQASDVNWAGRPPDTSGPTKSLEPRLSFKIWTERLVGRCRAWTDEQLDTAAVLALVYGKFIEVWRQKESALQMNQMTTLLLSNASHEVPSKVRTPLHQIINYLELALDGKKLDEETRENLTRSHAASKALLFTINDLLDLTRLEAGKETSFNEPFDLHSALYDAVRVYKVEAARRQIEFVMDLGDAPRYVVGDARKIKTVVANLTSNAVKYTAEGSVSVTAHTFEEPDGLRPLGNVAVEIVVSDTGCGIHPEKLESIFREFEQVDNVNQPKHPTSRTGLGLGLAVVARVVEQLGGQLRVDSKTGEGSRFSCLLPFPVADAHRQLELRSSSAEDAAGSGTSNTSEIDSLVEALSTSHMIPHTPGRQGPPTRRPKPKRVRPPSEGKFEVEDSFFPVRGVKVDNVEMDVAAKGIRVLPRTSSVPRLKSRPIQPRSQNSLRVLIVEDDLLNSRVLKKRLTSDGHDVETVVNGQQAVDLVRDDREFDCILMDIQMPILDGFGATKGIRQLEKDQPVERKRRRSIELVGRIPIFAVSASLTVDQREYMVEQGMDGWILKPIDFKRMNVILNGINNPLLRAELAYHPNCTWEYGGWLEPPPRNALESPNDMSPDADPKSSPSTANPSPETTV